MAPMIARPLARRLARVVTAAVQQTPPGLRLRAARNLARIGIAPGNPSMYAALDRLRACGLSPHSIVDVGACSGEWTRDALRIWPTASVVMFEPRGAERLGLERMAAEDPRISVRIALLGAERGYTNFYVTEGGIGTGSSVFAELTSVTRKKHTIPMYRLDDELGDAAHKVGLLKLDVQGYELEVLKGGPNTLAACEVVVIEIALLPYNAGAPLADDVIAYMRERDFALFDVAQLWRDRLGRVFHMDAVFVRTGSALRRSLVT